MGLPASVSPVISNVSIAVATAFVGSFGIAALAGYGVAARLEYILVPIAFGFGTALTAMVATNMGAGQRSARAARHLDWARPWSRPSPAPSAWRRPSRRRCG